jgi:hypothetical protein
VFDRCEASHAINLFDMNQKYADVISTDEIIAYLEGLTTESRLPEERYAGRTS